MICEKCGTEFAEGIFCPECGTKNKEIEMVTKIQTEDSQSKPKDENLFVNSTGNQAQGTSGNRTKQTVPKKRLLILGIAILSVIAVIFIAANWEGKADYIATVKTHMPFANSQGLPYTYGEVTDKYIVSPKWEVHGSDDVFYVDIGGMAKGTECEVVITIKVTQDRNDSDFASIRPEAVSIGNTKLSIQDDVVEFLLVMFYAYNEGYNDLSEILPQIYLLEMQGEISLSETYRNEMEGIFFKYPSTWEVVDAAEYYSEAELENSVVALSNEVECFPELSAGFEILKFSDSKELVDYLFISDKEFAGSFDADVSVIKTSIVELDGISARMIEYVEPGDIFCRSYFYGIGYDLYRVNFMCMKKQIESYETVFNAIMDTYVISGYSSDDDLSGYQEPIEKYWKLAGAYSDSMGLMTLSLNIYTSQEEGEIEIGNVEIYASNGQYYWGTVIPVEDNIYKVETDTGEEVLLVEYASDGVVVLRLYVDGQYVDEYQMEEHYES